jgi:multiple sugar transport system substrate-binding protein
MSKNLIRYFSFVAVLFLLLGALTGAQAQDPAVVTWFVGLGTGTNPHQIDAQNAVVEAFNAAHDDIELVINIAPNYEAARDIMTTLMASGEAPDIIGPVGFDGSNQFAGNWLDLQPLVDSTGYDLTQFPEAAVNFYNTDEGLIGLPLATFPSFIVYNRALFDEAGLAYPPTEHGAPYIDAEGNEKEWNFATLEELAIVLTVDVNGNDASSADFDAENVVQWGYYHQDKELREELSMFGSGSFYDPESGDAVVPDHWREEAQWYYSAKWDKHIAPNATQVASTLLQDKFESGNIAMIQWHTWGIPGLEGAAVDWDIAATPTHNGTITAPLHADTFRVMNTTANPEATFTVLSYLVGEASLDLLAVYGGMPARESDRATFFSALDEKFTQGVHWEVAEAALDYPDIPSHEAWMPNYGKSRDVLFAFQSLLDTTPGLDVNAELDTLRDELQASFDEVS